MRLGAEQARHAGDAEHARAVEVAGMNGGVSTTIASSRRGTVVHT
jgi:hypothetical protein